MAENDIFWNSGIRVGSEYHKGKIRVGSGGLIPIANWKNSKKCHFRPFFTNKIFSAHKSKVVGHQKLVNIGPSDQSFISGKVVFITNNPAEESQVISFQVHYTVPHYKFGVGQCWPTLNFWLADSK